MASWTLLNTSGHRSSGSYRAAMKRDDAIADQHTDANPKDDRKRVRCFLCPRSNEQIRYLMMSQICVPFQFKCSKNFYMPQLLLRLVKWTETKTRKIVFFPYCFTFTQLNLHHFDCCHENKWTTICEFVSTWKRSSDISTFGWAAVEIEQLDPQIVRVIVWSFVSMS
jgi:hypothetical protein